MTDRAWRGSWTTISGIRHTARCGCVIIVAQVSAPFKQRVVLYV